MTAIKEPFSYMNIFLERQPESAFLAPATRSHFDKNRNVSRTKSTARDAHFYQQFRAVWAGQASASSGRTSVTCAPFSILAPTLMRQFDRHISQQRHDLATLPGYAGIRVPAPWRDLSFTTTALYYHFAVTAHGSALAFTLRLDPDVEAKARQQPSAASWVQPRIASELRKAFGRRVEFWFALENARTSFASGLHLHGELVLSPYDAVAARKALRRAGGEWLAVRQHQAHTRAEPDPGWISYSLKEEPWNRPGWRFAHLRRFNGNHHAATNGVRSEARRLYDADREQMAISKR